MSNAMNIPETLPRVSLVKQVFGKGPMVALFAVDGGWAVYRVAADGNWARLAVPVQRSQKAAVELGKKAALALRAAEMAEYSKKYNEAQAARSARFAAALEQHTAGEISSNDFIRATF